jgi:hypothetical protein
VCVIWSRSSCGKNLREGVGTPLRDEMAMWHGDRAIDWGEVALRGLVVVVVVSSAGGGAGRAEEMSRLMIA